MMSIIEWRPDSCQCIIHIQMPQRTLLKVIKKCNLHTDKSDEKLLDAIWTHNHEFSSLEMIDKRREECKRIEKIGKSSSGSQKKKKKSVTKN